MTKNTKRVDELEVGDIVIFPYCKGVDTVSKIDILSEWDYSVSSVGIDEPKRYDSCVEVTYLGNNKEEKIMEAKVDESALYPYFDLLAGDEVNLKGATNIFVHVGQRLKNIHELFEGVLELTLGEVKTLYFERKMSKSKESPKTKKVKDLCIGDKVFFSLRYDGYEGEEIVTKLQEFSPTHIEIITEQGTEAIFKKDKIVSIID